MQMYWNDSRVLYQGQNQHQPPISRSRLGQARKGNKVLSVTNCDHKIIARHMHGGLWLVDDLETLDEAFEAPTICTTLVDQLLQRSLQKKHREVSLRDCFLVFELMFGHIFRHNPISWYWSVTKFRTSQQHKDHAFHWTSLKSSQRLNHRRLGQLCIHTRTSQTSGSCLAESPLLF